MASINSISLPDLSKLEPLDGTNYKRWSQKLMIYFEALEVDYVITRDVDSELETKFEKDNKTVRGLLLNHMSDTLFDLYMSRKSGRQIWDMLEKRYGGDDARRRRYVVGKWLQFQMVDDKPIVEQLDEYENLTKEILNEGMEICEIFQANVLIEKLPPSWSGYKDQLLEDKKRDLTLQELISHMRSYDANRPSKKRRFVEKPSFNRNDKKIAKKNTKVRCYVCGAPEHKAYQCFKRQGQPQNKHPG